MVYVDVNGEKIQLARPGMNKYIGIFLNFLKK